MIQFRSDDNWWGMEIAGEPAHQDFLLDLMGPLSDTNLPGDKNVSANLYVDGSNVIVKICGQKVGQLKKRDAAEYIKRFKSAPSVCVASIRAGRYFWKANEWRNSGYSVVLDINEFKTI